MNVMKQFGYKYLIREITHQITNAVYYPRELLNYIFHGQVILMTLATDKEQSDQTRECFINITIVVHESDNIVQRLLKRLEDKLHKLAVLLRVQKIFCDPSERIRKEQNCNRMADWKSMSQKAPHCKCHIRNIHETLL